MNPANATYISTATTTTVKSGRGTAVRLIVGETAAGAITVYDSTTASGTILLALKASVAEGVYELGVRFQNGLTVVTAGASKVTVVWE